MHTNFIPKMITEKITQKISPKNLYRKNLSLFQTAGTFPLPDFSSVLLPGGKCSCMTPQGICATEKYIIITAYCNIRRFQKDLERSKKKGHTNAPDVSNHQTLKTNHTHNSCLMVFDKKTHRYLALLELPDQNHVGGITCDGTYLWIAKSTDRCLSTIKETELNYLIKHLKRNLKHTPKNITSPGNKVARNTHQETNTQNPEAQNIPSAKIDYFQKTVPCDMTASFVTFFQKRIWVGYCAPKGKRGFLRSFQIQKNPHDKNAPLSLIFDSEISIPAKANGASFFQAPGTASDHIYLFLSISGGRKNASQMRLYSTGQSPKATGKNSFSLHLYDTFLLPPLLEESCIDKNVLYTLYESSSPAYKDVPGNSCPFPVDVVNMADINGFMIP